MKKLSKILFIVLIALLVSVLCGCAKGESALYKQYQYPNEEYFGKEVYRQIDSPCTEEKRKDVAQVLSAAEYVFRYTGDAAHSDKSVGALKSYYRFSEAASVDFSVKLITTKNDGRSGYMWVVYSANGFDRNGNLIYGSSNILAKWDIQKKSGQWVVVKIDEAP